MAKLKQYNTYNRFVFYAYELKRIGSINPLEFPRGSFVLIQCLSQSCEGSIWSEHL